MPNLSAFYSQIRSDAWGGQSVEISGGGTWMTGTYDGGDMRVFSDITFPSTVETRWVRFVGTKRVEQHWDHAIYEFLVFGDPVSQTSASATQRK